MKFEATIKWVIYFIVLTICLAVLCKVSNLNLDKLTNRLLDYWYGKYTIQSEESRIKDQKLQAQINHLSRELSKHAQWIDDQKEALIEMDNKIQENEKRIRGLQINERQTK